MTSHKYLSKKKGAGYAFFSGLRSAFLPAIAISGVLSVFMAFMPISTFLSLKERAVEPKEKYKFLVCSVSGSIDGMFLLVLLAVLSIAMGIIVFKFASDKKTVNVYYSLGIKRTTLFYSRFASGALLVCLAVMVPVILSYIVNLAFLKLSWQLSVVLIYYYVGLSLFCLMCYGITAAVFASVGTVSEGVVFSLGILAVPSLFFVSIEKLITVFLDNNAYGAEIVRYTDTYYAYDEISDMLIEYAAYNPLLFLLRGLSAYGNGSLEAGTSNIENWAFPDALSILPWFFVVIAAAVIGGLLFKTRKAENCGFLNTNKVLSNMLIFEAMIFAATLFISESSYSDSVASYLVIGAIAAVFIYFIAEIFLKRNIKAILKSMYKLPAHLAVIAIITGIFMTGGLGFDSYIPEASAVKSVAVSLPVSVSPYSLKSTSSYMGMGETQSVLLTPHYYYFNELPEMTSAKDIERVLALHKTILEDNSSKDISKNLLQSITVRYTLKNGTEKTRKISFYNDSIMKQALALTDSDAVNEALTKIFTAEYVPNNNDYTNAEQQKRAMCYEYSEVSAVNRSFGEQKTLNLSKEQYNALKQAVLADMTAENSADLYAGAYQQYGVLRFSAKQDLSYEELSSVVSEETTVAEEPVTDNPETEEPSSSELPEDETTEETTVAEEQQNSFVLPEDEETADEYNNNKYTQSYSSNAPVFNNDSGSSYYEFVVSANSVNTLKFLKDNNFDDCFDFSSKITSISFAKASKEYYEQTAMYDKAPSYEFQACSYSEFNSLYIGTQSITPSEVSENFITDEAKINELLAKMSFYEYSYGEGYVCVITFEDGTMTLGYINPAKAPDYVKNYNYSKYVP